jgi:predicted heme/steroid binding protein/predicted RNA-binding protein with PUA-like domain
MKLFTRHELLPYNGQNGAPAYVGYIGKVYDLSGSLTWVNESHHGRYEAGRDLTEVIGEVPHMAEELEKYPVIGTLQKPQYWLLKTEAGEYSWQDLVRDKKAVWDGVRGGLALKYMARMRFGDRAFIYHTGKEKSVVGIAAVEKEPYPDPGAENSRYLVVEVVPLIPLKKAVTLGEIKEALAKKSLKIKEGGEASQKWELVRLPRLSVVPLEQTQWDFILGL